MFDISNNFVVLRDIILTSSKIYQSYCSNIVKTVLFIYLTMFASSYVHGAQTAIAPSQTNNEWFKNAVEKVNKKARFPNEPIAKNVIIFIGDGMGMTTITASRIFAGQLLGKKGEEHDLSFDLFPYIGLSKTYTVNAQTPDSAGTITAIMTGVKTDLGVVGVDEDVKRGKCKTAAGNELTTSLELAEIAGKSTGIITNTRFTHATPSGNYAKTPERRWEDDSDMPTKAKEQGCVDIASQFINFEANLKKRYPQAKDIINGIEVAMGGGRRHFLPKDAKFNSPDNKSDVEGDRKDGRHLINEWQALYPDGNYVFDQKGFEQISAENTKHVFALFNESHMHYEANRHNDKAGEPSLTEMTKKAIDILDNNDKGFFLMVESGRIDHAHHANNAYNALNDTVELSNAVQAAVDMVNLDETLIIVTADHSHVFTIAGYSRRGNPILGKAFSDRIELAEDGLPYTTLGYVNGRGHVHICDDETDADVIYKHPLNAGRADLTKIDTTKPGFHQETLIPINAETHGGEDVSVYAMGPGAHLVSGSHEQNEIFHIVNRAANLQQKAEKILAR